MFGFGLQLGLIDKWGSSALPYLMSISLPEFTVGGNYNDGVYWKPSNPADPTSAPIFTTEADHFSAFQRPGTKWALNAQGVYVEYGANVPAFRWENGRRRLSLEGASTRITTRPDTPMTNWGISGSGTTKSAYSGTFLGVFSDACEVATGGQTWHGVETFASPTQMSGVVLSWAAYFRSGTSGQVRITLRNTSASLETRILGTIGNLSVGWTEGGSATITDQFQAPDGTHIVRGTWMPNANGSHVLRLGPDSATVGQTVIAVGGFLETSPFPTSPIFASPTTSATRPADNFQLPPAHEAVLQHSAATVLVRGGNVKNLAGGRILGCANPNNRIIGGNIAGDVIALGAGNVITLSSVTIPITAFGVAGAWDASGKAGSYNGAATVSSVVALDSTLSQIFLGRSGSGDSVNFAADLCAAAPMRLFNARLPAITGVPA